LLGDADQWQQWFALRGLNTRVNPVASFNDAGLMLQASEQGLGLALARTLLAADALRDGRLLRLSPLTLPGEGFDTFWLVYLPQWAEWPPLLALKAWLRDELEQSALELAQSFSAEAGTAPAGSTESRSPAPSAIRARSRAR
jgi:LysR family glycine cleavage system transcriptional activator